MVKVLNTLLAVLLTSGLFAQEKHSTTADCSSAIHLKDSLYGPTTSPNGSGKIMEITSDNPESLFYFEREHNTAWYHFTAPVSTLLTLEIIPGKASEDVDFLLFKAEGGDFCEKIKDKKVKPIRTNISRVQPEIGGKTGLSDSGTKKYVHSGPGDAFSAPLQVQKGATYYLVIDHYSDKGAGHSIHLHYKQYPEKQIAEVKENLLPEKTTLKEQEVKNIEQLKPAGGKGLLQISVVDDETGSPVKADLVISGFKKGNQKEINNISRFDLPTDSYKSYSIRAKGKGYIYRTEMVVTSGKADTADLEIRLRPIRYGNKIRISDIHFKGDKADILPKSEGALLTLTNFLKENEEVEIEIQGHVNAPENNKKARQLSEDRAKAVYNYLILKDIDRKRMDYKGYGNKQMIYPEPISEPQAQMNRRVEIKIVSGD